MEIPFGGKPYIFVSYSHKDESFVRPLIQRMSKLGYRIWYDGDLPYIRDYNNIIANAIINCSIFLAVLSVDSVKSEYVLDEIFLARNRNKDIIASFIDDCTIPPGMEMRIGRLNHLHYKPSMHDEFVEKLCSACEFCRGLLESAPLHSLPDSETNDLSDDMISSLEVFTEPRGDRIAFSDDEESEEALNSRVLSAMLERMALEEEKEEIEIIRRRKDSLAQAAKEEKENAETELIIRRGALSRLDQEDAPADNQISAANTDENLLFAEREDLYCSQHYKFSIISGNELEIQKCTHPEAIMHIPFKFKGKRITSIGNYAFKDCNELRSMTVPIGIKHIGYGAFLRCKNLVSISIPRSVSAIYEESFCECTNLSSIALPDNICDIGSRVFYKCIRLSKVLLSKKLQAIGESAFSNCISLSELTLPNTLQIIGRNAFERCSKIRYLSLPNSLNYIGKNAFAEAYLNITAPKSPLSYGYIPDSGVTWHKI